MTRDTGTRALIAVLIYSMTNGVLFGAGLILVLTLPVLSADTGLWISVVVGASFILAAPIAWWIAPRLRARYGLIAGLPSVLVVHPSLPVRSVAELIAFAKAQPGRIDYAFVPGTVGHITCLLYTS